MTYSLYRGPARRCDECIEVRSILSSDTSTRAHKVRVREVARVTDGNALLCWEHYNRKVRNR